MDLVSLYLGATKFALELLTSGANLRFNSHEVPSAHIVQSSPSNASVASLLGLVSKIRLKRRKSTVWSVR